jgi:biopolymer transport protein ExbB
MKTGSLIRAIVLLGALVIVAAVIFAAGSINAAKLAAGQRQNFFEQFFIAGGPVVWFVLFPMSLITVYLTVEDALTISRKNLLGGAAVRGDEFERSLAGRRDLARVALREALDKAGGDWFRARSIVQESLQEQAGKLLRKIEWLNLIGGVSPMVGLFGTVFGMIKLFNAIVAAGGQPQPAQLADGIGIALVTTFWGLFIAIPALAMHGIFRNRIEVFVGEAVTETEAMMPLLHEALRQKASAPRLSEPVRFSNVPIVPLEGESRKAAEKSAKK